MTPRPYRMDRRKVAADETRARVLAAARELLAEGGTASFRLEAVAERAGVTRTTVYHQFGSKVALIEEVFDSMAIVRAGVPRLVAALELDDAFDTLAEFTRVFGEMWDEDRLVIRRLQGLAALDDAFAQVWRARESRRREGLRRIVKRASAQHGTPDRGRIDAVVNVLFAIIAFETYDVIAGEERTLREVSPEVLRLARAAIQF
jgi:AcrR family transcriptional regulator